MAPLTCCEGYRQICPINTSRTISQPPSSQDSPGGGAEVKTQSTKPSNQRPAGISRG